MRASVTMLLCLSLLPVSAQADDKAEICANAAELARPFLDLTDKFGVRLTHMRLTAPSRERQTAAEMMNEMQEAVEDTLAALEELAELCGLE